MYVGSIIMNDRAKIYTSSQGHIVQLIHKIASKFNAMHDATQRQECDYVLMVKLWQDKYL